jgi:hypothetical protein
MMRQMEERDGLTERGVAAELARRRSKHLCGGDSM